MVYELRKKQESTSRLYTEGILQLHHSGHYEMNFFDHVDLSCGTVVVT